MYYLDSLPRKTSAMAFVRKIARVGLIWLSCTLVFNFVHGQAVQLADIIRDEVIGPNEYSELTHGNNRLFFIVWKTELWTSTPEDGNSDDTKFVKRFKSISNLTLSGSWLYFIGDDGVSGPELWKSNGSPDGTVKVKDIRSGAQCSNIRYLTNVYGTLYFSANDGKHGQELWRSNGGPKNTFMLKDILPNGGSSNPTSLTSIERTLYFSANDGVHGYELWKSSGTTAGTVLVKDIRTEPGLSSLPDQLANVNGSLYFAALSSGKGRELWRSDGTTAGTWLVKDIRPGSIGSEIQNTTAVNRTLFFTATDGIHGH